MARESAQSKLDRVRKPRVQIKYEVYKGDAMVMKELPFVMRVMGDFAAQSKKEQKKLKDREFVEIDRDTFDKVMSGMAPRLAFRVDDQLSGEPDKKLNVELEFRSIKDLAPENVARQIPAVRTLLEKREKLKTLLARMDGNDLLQAKFDEILSSTEKRDQLTRELGMDDQPPAAT